VLRSVLLFCISLYCPILHCTLLFCIILHRSLPQSVLHFTVLYCTVLHSLVIYCTVLYCSLLFCAAIFRNALFFTVLHCPLQDTLLRSIPRRKVDDSEHALYILSAPDSPRLPLPVCMCNCVCVWVTQFSCTLPPKYFDRSQKSRVKTFENSLCILDPKSITHTCFILLISPVAYPLSPIIFSSSALLCPPFSCLPCLFLSSLLFSSLPSLLIRSLFHSLCPNCSQDTDQRI
jgi:hypothetical protein